MNMTLKLLRFFAISIIVFMDASQDKNENLTIYTSSALLDLHKKMLKYKLLLMLRKEKNNWRLQDPS